MKPSTISLRRRHLMMAGLAGAAAPAPLFAGPLSIAEVGAAGSAPRLIVSGRILGGPDRKPLAGATVEVWHAGASGEFTSAATDGDGRFFATISPVDTSGRPRRIDYRVRHAGRETPVTHRISNDLVANLGRDDAGALRTTFGLTLA
jgi:protocatechuate 3,4-dioxygenase beta subunit